MKVVTIITNVVVTDSIKVALVKSLRAAGFKDFELEFAKGEKFAVSCKSFNGSKIKQVREIAHAAIVGTIRSDGAKALSAAVNKLDAALAAPSDAKVESKKSKRAAKSSEPRDVTLTAYLRELIVATETNAVEMTNAEIAEEIKKHFPSSAISGQYVAKSRYTVRKQLA